MVKSKQKAKSKYFKVTESKSRINKPFEITTNSKSTIGFYGISDVYEPISKILKKKEKKIKSKNFNNNFIFKKKFFSDYFFNNKNIIFSKNKFFSKINNKNVKNVNNDSAKCNKIESVNQISIKNKLKSNPDIPIKQGFYNCNIVKGEKFSLYANLTGRDKIMKWNNNISKVYNDLIDLKILVWNARSIGLDNAIRYTKLNAIRKIAKIVNPDVIYICDLNYENSIIDINFRKYFDGRNILLIRNEFHEKIDVVDNFTILFKGARLIFNYIPPNIDTKDLDKIFDLWNNYVATKNFMIIGDLNLASNNKIVDWLAKHNLLNNNISGEDSLQIVLVGKAKLCKTYAAPSDHRFVFFKIPRKLHFNSFLKLTKVKECIGQSAINNIFKGKETNIESKLIIKKSNIIANDYDQVTNFIINKFLENNPSPLYKRFKHIWSKFKREPFLGTYVDNKVIESWKIHLKHRDNKVYKNFNINLKIFSNDIINLIINSIKDNQAKDRVFSSRDLNDIIKIKFGFSHTLNYDLLGLKDIACFVLHYIWKITRLGKDDDIELVNNDFNNKSQMIKTLNKVILGKNLDFDKIRNSLLNIANGLVNLNNNKVLHYDTNNEIAKTFFLKKNEPIASYKDVRMIVIAPTLIKVYESLIYNEVVYILSDIINEKIMYQFGGVVGGSTYDALMCLRYKTKNKESDGILVSDIAEGYDNIDFDILDRLIRDDERINQRIKDILSFWIVLVFNIDYKIGDKIVKRTKGVPMGLSLSPIIFAYYLHRCLERSFNYFEDLVAFLDDTTLNFKNSETSDEREKKFQNLKDSLKYGGLELKPKKTFTIGKRVSRLLKDIPHKKGTTLLGVDIIHDGYIERNQDNFIEIDNNRIKSLPKWTTLSMKRILLLGAFAAKQRFNNFMLVMDQKYFVLHMQKYFNFFVGSFERLSYVEMFFLIGNQARELLDPFKFEKIRNDLINKYGLNKNKLVEIQNLRLDDIKQKTRIITVEGSIQPVVKLNDENKKILNNLINNKIIDDINNIDEPLNKLVKSLYIKLFAIDKKLDDKTKNVQKYWNKAITKLILSKELNLQIGKLFFVMRQEEIWQLGKHFNIMLWKALREQIISEWLEDKKNDKKFFGIKDKKFLIKFMNNSMIANKYAFLMDLIFGHSYSMLDKNSKLVKWKNLRIFLFNLACKTISLVVNNFKLENETWLSNNTLYSLVCKNLVIDTDLKKDANMKSPIFKVDKDLKIEEFMLKRNIMVKQLLELQRIKNRIVDWEEENIGKTWWGRIRMLLMVIDILWYKETMIEKSNDEVRFEIWNILLKSKEDFKMIIICEDAEYAEDNIWKEEENMNDLEDFEENGDTMEK